MGYREDTYGRSYAHADDVPWEPVEPKKDTFVVETRTRVTGEAWTEWKAVHTGLNPREAKSLHVSHAAYLISNGWEVLGINRLEITLEKYGRMRCVVHMRKEN